MLAEHRCGDRAHPAGNRRDGSDDRLDVVKSDISANSTAWSGIDTNVDDDLLGVDETMVHNARLSGGDYEVLNLTTRSPE